MNRIIVVTGGAAGIGRCTVEYFASKGDRIYFIDNNQEATLALTERMHQKGLNVTGYTGDIAENKFWKILPDGCSTNSLKAFIALSIMPA